MSISIKLGNNDSFTVFSNFVDLLFISTSMNSPNSAHLPEYKEEARNP